jgi:hypothetical protein
VLVWLIDFNTKGAHMRGRYLKLIAFAFLASSVATSLYAQKQPSPAEQEYMQQLFTLIKSTRIGEQHRELKSFEGHFTLTGKLRGERDGDWVHFSGSRISEMVEITSITGYDNLRQEYFYVYYDNIDNGVMVCRGDKHGNVWVFRGEQISPITGKLAPIEFEVTLVDEWRSVTKTYHEDSPGRSFKAGEIIYQRIGAPTDD